MTKVFNRSEMIDFLFSDLVDINNITIPYNFFVVILLLCFYCMKDCSAPTYHDFDKGGLYRKPLTSACSSFSKMEMHLCNVVFLLFIFLSYCLILI